MPPDHVFYKLNEVGNQVREIFNQLEILLSESVLGSVGSAKAELKTVGARGILRPDRNSRQVPLRAGVRVYNSQSQVRFIQVFLRSFVLYSCFAYTNISLVDPGSRTEIAFGDV